VLSIPVLLFVLGADVVPQEPAPQRVDEPRLGVRFDARGWPIVDDTPAAPGLEPSAVAAPAPATAPGPAATARLAEVFRTVESPAAFAALGGLSASWRLTVHGPNGESIGQREVAHLADAAALDRDRLQFADGRACGRLGGAVFAARHGMPWPTLTPSAANELSLFGLHLRLPWAFADSRVFAEVGADVAARGGASFVRIRIVARGGVRTAGPEPEGIAPPADAFELWCSEGSGLPRELVHTLACSGQQRRVLLEDWRPVRGVAFPFRRVYVDAAGRPTTTLELQRLEPGAVVSERDFRLR
jgi:hypothetical protein